MEIKRLFFLTPYLKENTTSVNRINSFISQALNHPSIEVYVLYFDFSIFNAGTMGIDGQNKTSLLIQEDRFEVLSPKLNKLQQLASWFIKKKWTICFKLTSGIHQLIYLTDIFTVHDAASSLKQFNLKPSDSLIALGGPFGIFKTSLNIKKLYDLNLFIDYRDPWTYGYPPIQGSLLFHYFKRIFISSQERKILNNAKHVFTVSDSLKKYFPKKFQKKITIIPNASNYQDIQHKTKTDYFNILYLGTIYNIQLENLSYFSALSKWINKKEGIRFKLSFIGSANNNKLNDVINKYQLNPYTLITNRLSKDEVRTHLEKASVLLHLKYGKISKIITSKQGDYLALNKPILLPISDNGDLAESILENDAGYICHSEKEIIDTLDILYQDYLNGKIYINKNRKVLTREESAKIFMNKVLSEITNLPNS